MEELEELEVAQALDPAAETLLSTHAGEAGSDGVEPPEETQQIDPEAAVGQPEAFAEPQDGALDEAQVAASEILQDAADAEVAPDAQDAPTSDTQPSVAQASSEADAGITSPQTDSISAPFPDGRGSVTESPDPVAEPSPESQPIDPEDLLGAAEAEPAAASTEDIQLKAMLEAIVYITEEPLSLAQIAAALSQPRERVLVLLDELLAEYDKPEHGVTIREVAGGYKMTTKAEHHETVRNFVKSLKPPLKMSLPALETLAVIAYKQPVTAPEIMEIRGVQGAGVLKTLLDRKLIAAAGRKNVIGKPILYKTTREFLMQFGLKDLSELPSLKEFEEIRRMAIDGDAPAGPAAPAPVGEPPVPEPPVAEPPVDEPPVAEPPITESSASEAPTADEPSASEN